MDARDRETAADIASRYKLRRKHPNEWRGECPCCGYSEAFVLTSKGGLPLFWCANGCARDALVSVVFGQRAATPARSHAAAPAQDRTELARRLWHGTRPAAGSLVEHYLASRGLVLPPGDALRFEASALHPNKSRLPAMRAAVRDRAGSVIALHTTYLRGDGSGKADVDPPRSTLGGTCGGAVRLFPAGERLIIGEGIETSLAAAELLGAPAWAALNAGNLAGAITPPSDVREVMIAVDNDAPGRRAASEALKRLRALGFVVKVALPDAPGDDFNDVLKRRRGIK